MTVQLHRHGTTWAMHHPGGRIGAHYDQGRPYEPQLLDEVWALGLRGSAIDVGAHVGNHALFFAAVCGLRTWAFEPDAAAFTQLVANIRLNPTAHVTAVPAGCGATPGRAHVARGMRLEADPDGPVPVVRLDDVLDLYDLAVVKVDVEGMEADVLAGCAVQLRRCQPVVYVETHTRTAGRKVAAVMEPLGYQATGRIVMGSTMERWEVA